MAKEAATAKDAQFRLISLLPDVCFTPAKPPHGVPVPYPITHDMGKSLKCSPNVFFKGKPAYLHETSYVDKVTGDEPGAGKGVVSGTHTQTSRSQQASRSVYINGRRMVRTGDRVQMNRPKSSLTGNTIGIIIPKTKPALPRQPANPSIIFETPAEQDFAAWRWVYSVSISSQPVRSLEDTLVRADEIPKLVDATIDAGLHEHVNTSLAAVGVLPFSGGKKNGHQSTNNAKVPQKKIELWKLQFLEKNGISNKRDDFVALP